MGLFNPQNSVKAGTISYFAANSVPSGWLVCDGAAVNRVTYARLFGVIGINYGAGDAVVNALAYPEDLRQDPWIGNDAEITTGLVGYNGTPCQRLTNLTNSIFWQNTNASLTGNQTVSCYFDAETSEAISLKIYDSVAGGYQLKINYNVTTGLFYADGGPGNWYNSHGVDILDDNWYRVWIAGYITPGLNNDKIFEMRTQHNDVSDYPNTASTVNNGFKFFGPMINTGLTPGDFFGATTFNLPDLRGEFLRGFDGGRGVDTGRIFGSAQNDEFKSHNHQVDNIAGGFAGPGAVYQYGITGPFTTSNAGGSETRPRNIALLPCIKF